MARHGHMWQRVYGFFSSTFICRATQSNISLFYQIYISIPTLLFYVFNFGPFMIKECLKEFRYCASVPGGLCFVVQKLALHQNGVECRQQSICNIRISPATSYVGRRATLRNVARKLADHAQTHVQTHTYVHTHNTTY